MTLVAAFFTFSWTFRPNSPRLPTTSISAKPLSSLSLYRHLKPPFLHALRLTPPSVTKSPRKDVVSSGHRLFLPAVHLHHHCHSSHERRCPRRCWSAAPWRCLQRSELRQVLRPSRIARNLVSISSNAQRGTATQFTAALSGKTVVRAFFQ